MRSKSFEGMACSIAGVLEAIGDRWAVLILRDLSLGLSRYEERWRRSEINGRFPEMPGRRSGLSTVKPDTSRNLPWSTGRRGNGSGRRICWRRKARAPMNWCAGA